MGLPEDLQAELRAAMRRRDSGVVAGLRTALAALANAQAVPPPDRPIVSGPDAAPPAEGGPFAGSIAGLGATEAQRRPLAPEEQRRILVTEMRELDQHAARLAQACRYDEADAARRASRALADVLARHGG